MKALIVGGGIGGLSTAIGLRRYEVEAHVFERAKELGTPGGGLHVWSNAMQALQAADVQGLDKLGQVVERTQFRTWTGKEIADWPTGDLGRKVGAPTMGTTRPLLHRTLADSLPADIIHLDCECTSYEVRSDGVVARFANGREEHGDVLIGADGTNSVVRAQLHGPEPAKYTGDTSWRTIIEDYSHPMAPNDVLRLFWGPSSRIAFYCVGPKRLYFIGYLKTPQGGTDPDGPKEAAKRVFGNYVAPWPEILEAADESRVIRTDIFDRDPIRRWGSGPVTLVGDAAHPMSPNLGQGACQSIEDGFVVARCLAHGDDPQAALRAYEKARRMRTARMVRLSRVMASVGSVDGAIGTPVRNGITKVIMDPIIRRFADADIGYKIAI
jgi:2-polyprenyl-6-methoxyphenol hydroxylase-like FAD-dependent oxidoreductase